MEDTNSYTFKKNHEILFWKKVFLARVLGNINRTYFNK